MSHTDKATIRGLGLKHLADTAPKKSYNWLTVYKTGGAIAAIILAVAAIATFTLPSQS